MGARSNVNLVKINNVNAKYEGITSYSHWGGVEHQIVALAAFIKAARFSDSNYGMNTILANILSYSGNGLNGGVNPFSVDTQEEAYQQELDNEYHILNINFGVSYSDNDLAEIAVYNIETGDTQRFPLSVQGAGRAARYLIRAEIAKYTEYGSVDNTVMGLRGNSNVNSIVKAAEKFVSSNVDLALKVR